MQFPQTRFLKSILFIDLQAINIKELFRDDEIHLQWNIFLLGSKKRSFHNPENCSTLFCPIFLISSYINNFIYSPIHFASGSLIKIDPQLFSPWSLLCTNI